MVAVFVLFAISFERPKEEFHKAVYCEHLIGPHHLDCKAIENINCSGHPCLRSAAGEASLRSLDEGGCAMSTSCNKTEFG